MGFHPTVIQCESYALQVIDKMRHRGVAWKEIISFLYLTVPKVGKDAVEKVIIANASDKYKGKRLLLIKKIGEGHPDLIERAIQKLGFYNFGVDEEGDAIYSGPEHHMVDRPFKLWMVRYFAHLIPTRIYTIDEDFAKMENFIDPHDGFMRGFSYLYAETDEVFNCVISLLTRHHMEAGVLRDDLIMNLRGNYTL